MKFRIEVRVGFPLGILLLDCHTVSPASRIRAGQSIRIRPAQADYPTRVVRLLEVKKFGKVRPRYVADVEWLDGRPAPWAEVVDGKVDLKAGDWTKPVDPDRPAENSY